MTTCVFSHEILAIVHDAKNRLEAEGIECQIRNEFHGGGGHVGLNIVPIELWVLRGEDMERAQQILAANSDEDDKDEDGLLDESPWICEECGEENERVFAVCWKCQTSQSL